MTVRVDWVNASLLHDAYWNYRVIATTVPWANRAPNMPSELTEAIVCLCTGAELIDEGHGDILLPSGHIGEVKGTSSYESDLSTFSPSSEFDKLYFVHMDPQTNNIYHVYDLGLNRKSIAGIKVNRTATFADHSKGNRRPRFSIISQIIKPKGMTPTWKVDMSKRLVIK
jgi:hypothetical protein